ncbi:hypothetical protein ACIQU6_05125 [Streptomyces sp. NPDC090442]|uniref:hypothetical protein n=1 Tax=Streptomyces sp. NPDC090442 TaxID=3365962 RepID=UPI0038248F66
MSLTLYAEKLLGYHLLAEGVVQEVLIRSWQHAAFASLESTRLLVSLRCEHREEFAHAYLYDRSDQETAQILGAPSALPGPGSALRG